MCISRQKRYITQVSIHLLYYYSTEVPTIHIICTYKYFTDLRRKRYPIRRFSFTFIFEACFLCCKPVERERTGVNNHWYVCFGCAEYINVYQPQNKKQHTAPKFSSYTRNHTSVRPYFTKYNYAVVSKENTITRGTLIPIYKCTK